VICTGQTPWGTAKYLPLYGEEMERGQWSGRGWQPCRGTAREAWEGWSRLIAKGGETPAHSSSVALLFPPATCNTQPLGKRLLVGEKVCLWAGGGGSDLEKEPQGQKGRWRWPSTMGRERWETETEGNGSGRPFLFAPHALTGLRKQSRVPQAHHSHPTPAQCSTVE